MSEQLHGVKLATAAAVAMKWTCESGCWEDFQGRWKGCLDPEPTEQDIADWLRSINAEFEVGFENGGYYACETSGYYVGPCQSMLEAMRMLVVAVAAREATDGK